MPKTQFQNLALQQRKLDRKRDALLKKARKKVYDNARSLGATPAQAKVAAGRVRFDDSGRIVFTKKPKRRKGTTKKRATKKRATKKRATKKRATKKRATKKRATKKRATKKRKK